MTPTELLSVFKSYGGKLRDTSDPTLLAGGYLNWAGGDLTHAIHTLRTHDGRHIDRPDFSGRAAALKLLEQCEPPESPMSDERKPDVVGVGKILVATWADGSWDFYRFDSMEYAKGFAHGYGTGSGECGSGNSGAYVLAGAELAELKEYDEGQWAEVQRMLRRVGLTGEVEGAA